MSASVVEFKSNASLPCVPFNNGAQLFFGLSVAIPQQDKIEILPEQVFEATDDEALFSICRDHVDRDHPEMERTDEQLRDRIAADAYHVETVA